VAIQHDYLRLLYIQSWTRTSCGGQGSNMKMIPIPKTILSSGLANLFILKSTICYDRRHVLKRGFCATIVRDFKGDEGGVGQDRATS